jgi:hypothetical protein
MTSALVLGSGVLAAGNPVIPWWISAGDRRTLGPSPDGTG